MEPGVEQHLEVGQLRGGVGPVGEHDAGEKVGGVDGAVELGKAGRSASVAGLRVLVMEREVEA